MELTITHQQQLSTGHGKLIDYISSYLTASLSDNETEVLERSFKYKKLRKYQFLFQQGDICKYMAFVLTGSVRMFSVSDKGIEHTLSFGIEQSWVCDYESFNMLTPMAYYMQALEDTELLLISNEHLQYLIGYSSSISSIISLEEKKHLISFQKRIHAAISMTTEERYLELINTSPEISGRFSLAMIATYLGVAPETLSRIRKNMNMDSLALI